VLDIACHIETAHSVQRKFAALVSLTVSIATTTVRRPCLVAGASASPVRGSRSPDLRICAQAEAGQAAGARMSEL
jgi:hypothetical protein